MGMTCWPQLSSFSLEKIYADTLLDSFNDYLQHKFLIEKKKKKVLSGVHISTVLFYISIFFTGYLINRRKLISFFEETLSQQIKNGSA